MALRGEKMKQRLLEVALKLFANRGYFQTSVDEVVEGAGSSKGSFYCHFPSKEAVFLALVDRMTNLLFWRVDRGLQGEEPAVERISNILRSVLQTCEANRDLARIILVEAEVANPVIRRKQAEVHQRFIALIAEQLDLLAARGYIPALNTRLAATAFFGSINESIVQWLRSDSPEPLTDWTEDLTTYNLRAIGLARQPEEA